MGLTREQIAAAADTGGPATKEVFIPELGGSVTVRELSGTLRNAFEAAAMSKEAKPLEKVILDMVQACVLDDDGNRIIDSNLARRLWQRKPAVVYRIRNAIIEISAISDEDREQLAENFGEAPSEGSSSGSPDTSDSL